MANEHAFGLGWDLAPEDLDLVTSLADADGNPIPAPRALGTYSPGDLQPRGDKSLTTEGIEAVAWIWDLAERGIRRAFREYCGLSLLDHSVQMTILTPIEDPDEYYLLNVWLYLPPIAEVSYDGSVDWVQGFKVTFAIEEILDSP
jgi:hypothetical protein